MPGGYTITETLREDERFILQRGFRRSDQHPVLLKSPASKHPSPDVVRQLERERDIGATLSSSPVLRPLALERLPDRVTLVLEDFRGVFLNGLLGAPMDLGRFLRIAARTAGALAEVHDHDVIHRDIRPDNLLVDPETYRVKITDLGLASLLPREVQHAHHPGLIEGSLAYMSPEQTGRMNRAVDHRTDLYSLGVTFHEMLAGSLPYRAADPLAWVHQHIAGTPAPLDVLVPGVPEVVSAIVLRLLSKAAEDRYQTARGLEHDLAACLAQWEARGAVEAFPLGQADVSERFQLPQKLYGREPEIQILHRAFAEVMATGAPGLVLLSGYSGVGKSSLVQELHPSVVAAQGLFLAGKFDEHRRSVPYSTVVQAFTQSIRQILAEPEDRIAARRGRLLDALGRNAQLIVDLIPDLALVLGEQPPVARLSPAEEKNRFSLVFRRFLGAFEGEGRPLVLFLDDLQWADAGSLALIQEIMLAPSAARLLLVGAYRDNEVSPTSPLAQTLDAIRAAGVPVRDVSLAPLSSGDLDRLIADTLRCDAARVRPLADLVEQKTRNNPFFVLQFLRTLYEQSLLVFDRAARRFSWDLGRIREKGYTENVVEFMAGKVGRLASEARAALTRAACLGDALDVGTLSLVSRRPAEALHADLWEALRDGLMIRSGGEYRFTHDRVRQAAYLLIPEGQRAETHLAIGRALLAATPGEGLEERVFDIVNQYNLGAALLADPAERERLAGLNLVAARRARGSAAYASAIDHLSAGIRLLGPDPFATHPALAYDLHVELAACAYLCGDLERAAGLLADLEPRAATRLDRARIRRLEVDVYTSKDALDEAVARGLAGLSLLGIHVPPHPTWEDVERVYDRVWRALGDRPIEDLVDLPPMTDPETCAAQDILAVLFAPALSTDRNLPLLIYGLMVDESLAHGHSEASALGYAYFGMILGPAFGRWPEGYRFGKLGHDLMERRGTSPYRAKITCIFGDNTLPWTHPLREALPYLDAAFRAALETGDVTFACYCCNRIVVDRLVLGHPLDEVDDEAERRLAFTRQARFDASTQAILSIQGLVRGLSGRAAPGGAGDDDPSVDGHPWAIVRCWHHIMKLEARVLAGDFREALADAARAREVLWSTLAHAQEPEFWYFGALALAGHFDDAGAAERPALLAAIREHEQRLAAWAAACPENFANKHALVVAEHARIEDRPLDAMRAYDEAARLARESGYVQNEAIAHEAAGRFYLARGFEKNAATYLREARSGYAQWGAHGKVAQMDQRYPALIEPAATKPLSVIAARPEQLDLLAVLRASQAISGEMDLGRLLEALVRTVMQQSGAQRGLLLLVRDDALRIEAEASAGPAGAEVLVASRSVAESAVPESIVAYVKRSRRTVLLDDASRPNLFSADPYLGVRRPRSLLCSPILQQAELVGVLYLENNLIPGAFNEGPLAAVQLLAAQAAISLQNALLLRGTQEALRIRDEFLSIASHELKTPLTPLRLQMQLLRRHLLAPELAGNEKLQGFRRLLATSDHNLDRLTKLVEQLLDVSRISAGKLSLQREDVDLAALVREAAESFREELGRARCPLTIAAGEPVTGRWDRFRLEQVVVNLLSNAMKYGAGKPIAVSVGRAGARAELSVADEGIGIAPEAQARIFDRFERAASSRSFGGLGLGLYITRRIVEMHDGAIHVASEPGRGATFTVVLPLDEAPPG